MAAIAKSVVICGDVENQIVLIVEKNVMKITIS